MPVISAVSDLYQYGLAVLRDSLGADRAIFPQYFHNI